MSTTTTTTTVLEPIPDATGKAFWAYSSNGADELDPELKSAQHFAECDNPERYKEAESTPPILLRNLLSGEQIDHILKEASAEGTWPRGLEEQKVDGNNGAAGVPSEDVSGDLKSKPHHFAWTEDHVVLYMHNNDYWFVRALPSAWCHIRGGMECQPGMEDAIPILDEAFVGVDTESMRFVRTIELHHYSAGGGLITPGHRDCGSALTISVLLSEPEDISGGDFVTYDENDSHPVPHKMGRGDAILFRSEKLHNIATITSGVRKSLVVELWPSSTGL